MNGIFELISKSKTIALFGHINCDGDAVGSVMAFRNYLSDLGKKTYVFLQKPISDNYYFMEVDKYANKSNLLEYDLAISCDCPNTKRFGIYETEFYKCKKSINIDHHPDNENFADINIVNAKMCSTCEIVYDLFRNEKVNITSKMATCLYSGIASDTGRFIHGNMTSDTFAYAGELVKFGADLDTLNYNLFSHMKMNEFLIFRLALSKTEFYEDGKIAFIGITQRMLDECNADTTSTYRIIDQINSIHGVEIAVLLTQNGHNENMVSVRSRNKNAQRICRAFGGGGHLRAAGCRIFVPFKKAKELLIEECKRELLR